MLCCAVFFFFSSRRRHTRFDCDWSSDVCSSDLPLIGVAVGAILGQIALVFVDVALIRVAIRTIVCKVLLVLPNVFLVALRILLLGGWILGVNAGHEQTSKRHCERTATNQEFCFHGYLLSTPLLDSQEITMKAELLVCRGALAVAFAGYLLSTPLLDTPPHLGNQTRAAGQSFAM